MYRTVNFHHEHSAEWLHTDGGDEVSPESRALPDEVARIVATKVTSIGPVTQHEYYGWGFEATLEECTFYSVFNIVPGLCTLTTKLRWSWVKTLLRKQPRHTFDRFCMVLEDALQQLPGVTGIVWEE